MSSWALAAVAIAALGGPAGAIARTLVVEPGLERHDASDLVEVYTDASGKAGPAEVRSARFRPRTGRGELAPRGGALWIRFHVENRTVDPRTWFVSLHDPLLERVDVWIGFEGSALHRRGGVEVPLAKRTIELRGPWHQFPMLVLPEERVEVLARLESAGPIFAGVGVSESAALDRAFLAEVARQGVLLGILVALAALNLYSFIALRDRGHLAFLALTAAFVAFTVAETGLGPAFLWPGVPWVTIRAPAAFAGLALSLALWFADAFLGTRSGRTARALAVLPLTASAVVLFDPRTGIVAILGASAVCGLKLGARVIGAARARTRTGTFFAIAFGPLVVATFAFAATEAGVVPWTWAAWQGIHLSFPVCAFMVAFALADRVRSADGLARARLEQAVAARTAELATSLEALRREADDRRGAEAARRASEEKLRHAQRIEAVGRLAGGIAHDYNNVLTSVSTNVGLLLMRPVAEAMEREILEDIREAAERATVLTRQLLAFSRRQVLERQPLSANRVVEGLRRMLDRLVGENYELRLQLADGLLPIVADPGQLEQVLMNLVLNARDAMPAGGRIEIATEAVELPDGPAPGRHVRISVTDHGKGIAPEQLAHVFEPFYTTKPDGKGTGLGLATAHGIVLQHGGFIEVDPGPGRGAIFRVHFPVTAVPARDLAGPMPAPAAARPGLEGGRETVLLVEDDLVVREAARRLLGELGYRVLAARDAEDAMRTCERGDHPDLVFTDLVMPGMNGLDLAERVRVRCPSARILLTSGHAHDVLAAQGAAEIDLPFLAKPYTPAALAAKVRSVLDVPAASRQPSA